MISIMNQFTFTPVQILATMAASGIALGVVLLAFEGWVQHGTDIFLSLAESGMSWCF